MVALYSMYKNPSANKKVHSINLRMAEDTLVTQHLNESNTIIIQLLYVETKFDNEIRALILLASLPSR